MVDENIIDNQSNFIEGPKQPLELLELIKNVFNLDKTQIKMFSQLSQTQIMGISGLLAINTFIESEIIDEYINSILYLSVSDKRKGREELIKLLQNAGQNESNALDQTRFDALRDYFRK